MRQLWRGSKPSGQHDLDITWSSFESMAANLRAVGSDRVSHVVSKFSIPESTESRIRSTQGKKLVWQERVPLVSGQRAGFFAVELPIQVNFTQLS